MCLSRRIFLVFYKYSVDVENTIFCRILGNNLDSYHADFVYLIECISCALFIQTTKVLNYENRCQYRTRIYESKKIRDELKV